MSVANKSVFCHRYTDSENGGVLYQRVDRHNHCSPDRHDELPIAVAPFEYSREWATAEHVNAERASFLWRVLCKHHGLTPSEAVLEIV